MTVAEVSASVAGRSLAHTFTAFLGTDGPVAPDPTAEDLAALRSLHDLCLMHAHVVRTRPKYSARQLASELAQILLSRGFLTVRCEIDLGVPVVASDESVQLVGEFTVDEVLECCPPPISSWVAEAAWKAVPRTGRFTVDVPAKQSARGTWLLGLPRRAASTQAANRGDVDWLPAKTFFSLPVVLGVVVEQIEAALSQAINSTLRGLLDSDGRIRFASRGVAYGADRCMLEACPTEDGIDALTVLDAALALRHGDTWPPGLQNASAENKEQATALAVKICGMMRPKDWRSTEREKLDARPVFVSRNTVVLELAQATARNAVGKSLRQGSRLTVNRNAFSETSEDLLVRLEESMQDFVSLLNTMALESAGQDPDDVEARWQELQGGEAEKTAR